MVVACHCDGNGWKFYGDSTVRSKFWGQSIQLDPVGILTLEFDDGEIFQWSKVNPFSRYVCGKCCIEAREYFHVLSTLDIIFGVLDLIFCSIYVRM